MAFFAPQQVAQLIDEYRFGSSVERNVNGSWWWHVPVPPGLRDHCINNTGVEPNRAWACTKRDECLAEMKKIMLSL